VSRGGVADSGKLTQILHRCSLLEFAEPEKLALTHHRYPLLEFADPVVANAVRQAGLPPFFALSWFVTWFSHSVDTLQVSERLGQLKITLGL
jgi:hypothetical protein